MPESPLPLPFVVDSMTLQEFTQRFYQLTPKPKTALILLLEGKTDLEIGVSLGARESTVRKHIQNLCDHFAIESQPGEGKQQRRLRLIEQGRHYLGSLLQLPPAAPPPTPLPVPPPAKIPRATPAQVETVSPKPLLREDWGNAPDHPYFLGRAEELATLSQWIQGDRCRLVALVGLKGSGKTCLGVKVAQQVKADFQMLSWRSLKNGQSLTQLLDDWSNEIAPRRAFCLTSSIEEQVSDFLQLLREFRCLFILDDWESLLQSQALAGTLQPSYQEYHDFLHRISQEIHQSCFLMLSEETPQGFTTWETAKLAVRKWELKGWGQDAKTFLQEQGMKGEKQWDYFLQIVGDLPLNLILTSSVVHDLFAGEIGQFLTFNPLGLIAETCQLLQEQLSRLSPPEWHLLYWFLLLEKDSTLREVQQKSQLTAMSCLSLIQSLQARSLITPHQGKFMVNPPIIPGILLAIAETLRQELQHYTQNPKMTQFVLLSRYDLAKLFNPKQSLANPFRLIWQTLEGENPQDLAEPLSSLTEVLTSLTDSDSSAKIPSSPWLKKNLEGLKKGLFFPS